METFGSQAAGNQRVQATLQCGMLGAMLMLIADMLMMGLPISATEYNSLGLGLLAEVGSLRLVIGGLLGVLAAVYYYNGFGFIVAIIPQDKLGRIATSLYRIMAIAAGVYHFLLPWPAILADGRLAAESLSRVYASPVIYSMRMLLFTAALLPMIAAGIILLLLILSGRLNAPVWIAMLVPGIPLAFIGIVNHIPAPLGDYLNAGWLNLTIMLFFVALLLNSNEVSGPAPLSDNPAIP